MASFSERHGIAPDDPPITSRNSAPLNLRNAIRSFAAQAGVDALSLASLILEHAPVHDFSDDRPLVDMAKQALMDCEWFRVYDIAEAIADFLWQRNRAEAFVHYLNDFFRKNGIGWQMVGRKIEVRGPSALEQVVRQAVGALDKTGRPTASRELHEALHDLSRRPQPDVTGAVQHAGAALECAARDVGGDAKKTLGDL
jgi:hypothetical protein